MYGGSFNYNWDWAGALLRFETSFVPNSPFVNSTDSRIIQRPELKGYAEIDRPISWNSEFEELSVTGSFLETYNAGDTHTAFQGGTPIHYPFPKANTALEAMWNHFFNYFGLDDSFTITKEVIVDQGGSVLRNSDGISVNIQPVGRVAVDPIPVDENFKEYLLRTSVVILSPFDDFGTSVMNSVYYDGDKMPTTDGYIPTLKRVRKFPSNDRFDPVGPYSVGTVSEYYIQGDPLLTWSWNLVATKPL